MSQATSLHHGFIQRLKSTAHRYVCFTQGRMRIIETHEKDHSNLSALFGQLNALALPAFLVAGLLASPAYANDFPTNPQVVSGSASFSQPDANTYTITASNKAIINYNSFDIGLAKTVNIISPLSLHRVTGGNPSQILGTLNSTGKVFLVNPSGIFFGPQSQVNVQSLIASTLNISDEDFLGGNYHFTGGNQAGAITNLGNIQFRQDLAFIAPAIVNDGIIKAIADENITAASHVNFAVGNEVTLNLANDVTVGVTVDESLAQAVAGIQDAILNEGTIEANTVSLQAKLANNIYSKAVNHSGRIQALSVGIEGGDIVLQGSADDLSGLVVSSGELIATNDAGQGGSVAVLGNHVELTDDAVVDVSGTTGGGKINIGGGFQGKDASLLNSISTTVGRDVALIANATKAGNGGQAVVWSNGTTKYFGHAEAKGGSISGNGGLIEVSGKQNLLFRGTADTSAENGSTGTLLLDPSQLFLIATEGDQDGNATDGTINSGDPDTALNTLSWSQINALAPNTNVLLEATDLIQINDMASDVVNLKLNSSGSLTLRTTVGDIRFVDLNDLITTEGADVAFYAGNDLAVGRLDTTGVSGSALGGSIDLQAKNNIVVGTDNLSGIDALKAKSNISLTADSDLSGLGDLLISRGNRTYAEGHITTRGNQTTLLGDMFAAVFMQDYSNIINL